MAKLLESFRADELGTTSIEYALMASLIAMAIFGTIAALGTTVFDVFAYIQAGDVEAATVAAAGSN
jgi:Flp pilus assembly pilin Flp